MELEVNGFKVVGTRRAPKVRINHDRVPMV